MSKAIVNNRINSSNIYGRAIQHDIYLNQGVRSGDSPTFNNLVLSGDATINGNLYVEGNTTLLDTNTVQFKDNIILINDHETNSGVTLNQSGLEIDRGLLENFRIIYNEMNKRIEVGLINNLQPIVLRESNPFNNGIMVWNSVSNLIVSSDIINIPITFKSTINSSNSSTGSVIINGGLGIKSDVYIDGSINLQSIKLSSTMGSLNISTLGDINLIPTTKIFIPYNKPIVFGNNNQSIIVNTSGSLNINTFGDINLTVKLGQSINIPNQIPLIFSTLNEKIYTDNLNNMIITGSQDINLVCGINKKILIPVNTPLVFSNINQSIIANTNNDLIINANNNIFLNPILDVKIPSNSGLTFGVSGKIISNNNNELILSNNGSLFLNANLINIPSNISLTFSNTNQNIYGDTNGSLVINAANHINSTAILLNSNTTNSINASTGSIYTLGGLGVTKDIYCESSVNINSNNTRSFIVKNNIKDLFIINSKNSGEINIFCGDGTPFNPSLEIMSNSLVNSQSLIQLKTISDTTIGYNIGRMNRNLLINLPSYSDYSNLGDIPKFSITSNSSNTNLFSIESDTGNIITLGTLTTNNTQDSISSTTGSLVILGGLGISKSIYTSGIYNSSVDSTSAFLVQNSNKSILFNIDTIDNSVTINQKVNINQINTNAFSINNVMNIDTVLNQLSTNLNIINQNTIGSTDTSTGSYILSGGVAIQQNLNVGGISTFYNGINMMGNFIFNLKNPIKPQDAATKAYVDLIKQGLYVKDSVNVATVNSGNLNIDFVSNSIIDNYTLNFGDRILIKNQVNSIENGIYSITDSIPIRTLDLQNNASASGIFVFVKSGTINVSLGWICNSQSPDDITGINQLNFTEFTGLGQVHPGLALHKTFNEIDVNVDNVSIEVETVSNSLRIKNTICSTGLTGGSGSPLQTITDQSHVTKLGTINTGVWQGTKLEVTYGGTGRSTFNQGNVLFGNGLGPINIDSNFYYDNVNTRLGLGTNSPSKDIEIKSLNTVTLLLNSDSDGNNSIAKPEILLSYNGSQNKSYIGMTRSYNEYASNIFSDALVISNNQINATSIIQLATSQISRLTILSNGYIGINTSTPNSVLDVNGTLKVSGITKFTSTINSISSTMGSVILLGGISINCSINSTNSKNGGALTVAGGSSINRDLYVGGSITAINTNVVNTFAYLNIISTDNSINLSTGSLVTVGGITIQCSTDSTSVTSGAGLSIVGGASIGKSLYIGSTVYAQSDSFLGNVYFKSNNTRNYIQAPNTTRDTSSFNPISFTQYNNTAANILTISNDGIILNKNRFIQIGGTLEVKDGYTLYYTTGNLNVIPNTNNYNVNFGTIGSYSNLNIYGTNGGQISWQTSKSNLLLSNSSIQLTNTSGSVSFTTPNNTNTTFIQANSSNMILNLGGSGDSQLTTILSNNLGSSNITFIPSNITNSSLQITNVYTTINSPITLNDRIEYSGNALHQTILNNNTNQEWVYFGSITGYTEIDFNNGVNGNSDISGLKLCVAINNTTCTATHSHYGNLLSNSNLKPICYIYNDATHFQLFVRLAGNSTTNINVTSQMNIKFLLLIEGTNTVPSGVYSNFSNSWTQVYTTQIESTLKYTTGDLTIEGTSFKISDNLPIIGYNNINTVNSRDLGILYQRYQISNDTGSGDIVNGKFSFIDSIVNQSLISSLSQIKFSNLTSSIDNYYNGFWIKIMSGNNINQTRKIISYTGSQHIATLDSPFTTQNPNSGDTVYFYSDTFIANYYDEINNTFLLAYTSNKSTTGTIISNGDANLRLKSLYSTDTTVSTNSSSGSVRLLGGLSINSSSDAISSSSGGSITTAGGISVSKNLIVGNNIGMGTTGFTPQESIHIRKTIATERFEHDQGSYSYIDFMENSTSNRFGILLDSSVNQFSLTNTNSAKTPVISNKALTINNLGYIGINTTSNIISPLSINTNNFISTNSTNGFLGIMGGASNTDNNSVSSRIILNSNANLGSLKLYSGNNTSATVSIFTSNDIERLRIENTGIIRMTSSQISDSNTTGALVISGGVCVSCTQNASAFTSGGALSIAGGASISKDLYIGGNILINGNFTATGNIKTPTINFISFTNCSLIEYFNNNLILSGNAGVLTFGFSVNPTVSSLDTEIIFALPSRSNNLIRRFEVVSSVTGYTDDTLVTPLFNILGAGIVGTTNVLVKFQSVSTAAHYIQVQCTYILS